MRSPDGVMWLLASSPQRARCDTQAVERYLHMVRTIMTHAAASPGPETPFPPPAPVSLSDSTRRSNPRVDHGRRQRGATLPRLKGKLPS
jgi:hypothetical protein